jgi:hypothetical protein
MGTLIDDLAANEPLMVALGRIVLRSAELGEAVDDLTRLLDPENSIRSRRLMLGQKLALAKTTAESVLFSAPELRQQLMCFYDDTLSLVKQHRNSPIHSTFLTDDVEGVVIMWNPKCEPELIRIDDLNQGAEQINAKTRRLRQFRHEIQNFLALRPHSDRT